MAKKDFYSRNPFDNEPEPQPEPAEQTTPTPAPANPEVHPDSDDSILDVFDNVASVREGASGAIQFEHLPDPGSNPSLVSWTEVIRQQREATPIVEMPLEPVKIDSVSDRDLLRRIVAEEQQRGLLPPTGIHDTDKLGMVDIVTKETRSSSSIQLDDAKHAELSPFPTSSRVRFDAPPPPSDAGGAIPMPWGDSGILEAIPLEDVESSDDIPLAEALPLDDGGSFAIAHQAGEGDSVARMLMQDQDDDAIADLPLDLEDAAKHSSILDVLMQDEKPGGRMASDIVDIAGSDRSHKGSSALRKDFLQSEEAPLATAADSGVSPIRTGADWLQTPLSAEGGAWTDRLDELPPQPTVPQSKAPLVSSGDSWTKLIDAPGAEPVSGVDNESVKDQFTHKPGSSWSISDDQDSVLSGESIEIDDQTVTDKTDSPWPQPKSARPGSTWEMGGSGKSKPTMPSIQLPPEEAEEAVDLYAEGPFNQGISDSGRLQINEEAIAHAAKKQQKAESSHIDLGSKGKLSSMFDLDAESRKLAPEHGTPVEEAIDWSLPGGGESESSMVHRFDDVAADDRAFQALSESGSHAEPLPYDAEEVAAADLLPPPPLRGRQKAQPIVEEEAFPAEAEYVEENEQPAAPPAKAAKPEKAKKKKGGLLAGTFLGIILGGGGLFAAYYLEQLPSDPKSLFGEGDGIAKGKTGGPVGGDPKAVTKTEDASPQATPLGARQLLESGNAAQAVATYDKLDPAAPDVLAGRGQAKWLDHLQKASKDGKNPKRDDAAVVAALADLKSAVEKAKGNEKAEGDAARAYLWQGMIEESFGDYAAAEKIYTEAVKEMSAGNHKAIFEAANNRLQVVRPVQGADLGAIVPAHLLIAFTLLLADEPMDTPKATEPAGQECGFLFWEAMLLAVKHDYAKAAERMPLVKAVHARQQVSMAGRGLNPLSDPREQILPTCLDELQRYWLLCDQLYKRPEAKMLVEQRKIADALGAVFAKAKESEAAVKDVIEKLMPKPDQKIADAIDEVVKARKDAEEGKKVADDLLAGVGKQLKDAGVDDPKVEEGVKKLVAGKTDAEAKVKAVAELLEKAGIKDPDLNKALSTLVASRDDAEAIVKTLRERFEKAKYIDADASKEMVLKAVDEAISRGAADAVVKLSQENRDASAKIAKLEGDLDKTKKDADELLKKTVDEAEAAKNKAMDEAQALVKKLEKGTADQKTMYEDRLANAAKDFVLHVGKSDNLLKEGHYDASLNEYLAGVKTLKALPKEQEDVFQRILASHPAMQKLNVGGGDPSLALKHYTIGLEYYRDGQFDRAEQEFSQATQFENKDARYRYFLGMARWRQNKTDPAAADFTAAAALEAQGRPTSRVINSLLEGIQGPVRAELEKYRP